MTATHLALTAVNIWQIQKNEFVKSPDPKTAVIAAELLTLSGKLSGLEYPFYFQVDSSSHSLRYDGPPFKIDRLKWAIEQISRDLLVWTSAEERVFVDLTAKPLKVREEMTLVFPTVGKNRENFPILQKMLPSKPECPVDLTLHSIDILLAGERSSVTRAIQMFENYLKINSGQ